jgi:cysteine-rich repeat protein
MERRASMWFAIWIVLGLFGVAACGGGDTTTTDDGATDVEELGDEEDVPDDVGDVRDRTDVDVREDGTETDVPPSCGDGVVDTGEDCDDGNTVEGDGCENDCTYSCESSTECDDDNDCNGTESCTDHACEDGTPPADGTPCTLPTGGGGVCRSEACVATSCGDGVEDTGEECDDGNTDDTDACLSTCQDASCGDGFVQTGVETCDDGNTVPDDGCETDCSYSCTTDTECDDLESCNGGETCDTTAHACEDGTPPAEGTPCTLPTGGAGNCRGEVCASPLCGNGTVDSGEECDDGNTENTDACLSTCVAATCGDGFVHATVEACDSDPARSCTTSCSTTGTQTCTACAWSDCVPPAEICNGLDEDCTGGPDNGFTCVPAATGSCTTSCSTTGSHVCSSACEWGSCTPPAEVCNGLDDDCVGGADNGFACAQGTSQSCSTICSSTGSQVCSATCAWGTCTPPAEVCNGRDDDCVSGADNGFACVQASTRSCTTTCSSTGVETCSDTCAWGGTCAPPAETCNGRDDDCVGGCDNGFACCAGQPTTCTTSCGSTGIGTCTTACAAPAATACTPPVETCNGLDDDCVGGADNGFACVRGATRACTVGACAGTETCGTTCTWGTCNLGAAPANDACAGAVALTPGTPIRGTTCAATNNYAPPGTCVPAGATAAADVTYVLRVLARSNVVLNTNTTTWDTVLYIYSSSACSGATVACDDDSGTGNASEIDTVLDPGTYYIVVDGYQTADNGPFVLNSTVTPVGDECTDAIPLTLTAARTTVTGTTAIAFTNSGGSCTGGTTPTSPDVWYSFTLTEREQVFINTYGSAYDTQLALLDSCGGVAPTCEDDDCTTQQDQIVRTLAAGTYYVLVDGWNNASGAFTLNIEHLPIGGSNGMAVMALAPGAASLVGATDGLGSTSEATGSCYTGPVPSTASEVFYYWTTCPAGLAGTFTATTCNPAVTNYDTLIYLRSGVTGLDLACNDDIAGSATCIDPNLSAISAAVPAGTGLFGFYVDGWGAFEGDFLATVVRP